MTASRDIQNARPSNQSRSGGTIAASSVPGRTSSYARPHAHSISMGTLNPGHRVSRRKSSSSLGGVNITALAAAASHGAVDSEGKLKPESVGKHPTSFLSPLGGPTTAGLAPMTTIPDDVSLATSPADNGQEDSSSAIVDGPSLSAMASEKASSKGRGRRASEGARLHSHHKSGEHRKSNAGELRCDQCGKTYKHGSCLSKHLWEHTPEWAYTSKLLISKHQQVQLLEAASVLINMNQDSGIGADSALHPDSSDLSSGSPAPSGISDMNDDDDMSSRSSTPSLDDSMVPLKSSARYRQPKREDSYSSVYSRSYQSNADSHPFVATSAPGERDGLAYYRSWQTDRPSTAHSNVGKFMPIDENSDVSIAAEGLVSCSLNTPQQGPVHPANDVPPMPQIPAKYSQATTSAYRMDVDGESRHAGGRTVPRGHDDDDEGVFGRMEQ